MLSSAMARLGSRTCQGHKPCSPASSPTGPVLHSARRDNSGSARCRAGRPRLRPPSVVAEPAANGAASPAAQVPLVGAGDAMLRPDDGVTLAVRQLHFDVTIMYSPQGRILEGASRIWVHVGHSGWKETCDVELSRLEVGVAAPVWVGAYRVPAAHLPVITHLELQLAFKGEWPDGHVAWDNNGNRNWSSGVELSSGRGLVTGNSHVTSQAAISSLLLRLDHLSSRKLLTAEQVGMLRTLAWSKDIALIETFTQSSWMPDEKLAEALRARCSFLRRPGMHVVHVAAELAPIAKVGGLADVVTSLARAHQSLGHLVEIVLPKYDCIEYTRVADLRTMGELLVPWGTEMIRTLVWSGVAEGLPCFFLEPHSSHKMFWRGTIYGCPDDVPRFLFFSRAALELLVWMGKRPDVLHVHDWQSAAAAVLLPELYRKTCLANTNSVLTIHNLAFQGVTSPDLITLMGLDATSVYNPDKLMHMGPKNLAGEADINVLRGGVQVAGCVTTVSPRYAAEVLTPAFGCGLQDVLARLARAGRFHGVLNGIDLEMWDPTVDDHIAQKFDAETSKQGKLACKQALLRELGLPWHGDVHPSGRPLVAVVSRLTEQKGLPLILHGMKVAIARGAQVVVLGSAPDPAVDKQFVALQKELGQGDRGRIVLRFDEGLSHRIYASADMILIPSAFEPCGLTQLISLRYGTVPVVRETGGLADTVQDVFHSAMPESTRNGYVFRGSDEASVEEALSRAIQAYQSSWDWWSGTLVKRCMVQDWSWERSAQQYLQLYAAVAAAIRA